MWWARLKDSVPGPPYMHLGSRGSKPSETRDADGTLKPALPPALSHTQPGSWQVMPQHGTGLRKHMHTFMHCVPQGGPPTYPASRRFHPPLPPSATPYSRVGAPPSFSRMQNAFAVPLCCSVSGCECAERTHIRSHCSKEGLWTPCACSSRASPLFISCKPSISLLISHHTSALVIGTHNPSSPHGGHVQSCTPVARRSYMHSCPPGLLHAGATCTHAPLACCTQELRALMPP